MVEIIASSVFGLTAFILLYCALVTYRNTEKLRTEVASLRKELEDDIFEKTIKQ